MPESSFGAGYYLLYTFFSGKPTDVNNHLFYALGGAEVHIEAVITKCHCSEKGGLDANSFDAKAKVTIKDRYTFPYDQIRMLAAAYSAANLLENAKLASAFTITASFEESYTVTL